MEKEKEKPVKLNKSGNLIGMTPKHSKTREWKKQQLIEALERNHGIVTYACNDVDVERATFYKWCREDSEFDAKVKEVLCTKKDFIEHKLMQRIDDNDTTAIIFASKCLNRDRGYSEKQEIDLNIPTFEIKIS